MSGQVGAADIMCSLLFVERVRKNTYYEFGDSSLMAIKESGSEKIPSTRDLMISAIDRGRGEGQNWPRERAIERREARATHREMGIRGDPFSTPATSFRPLSAFPDAFALLCPSTRASIDSTM